MLHNPHIHLALARARQEDILREARRHRLRHVSGSELPSALTRIAALMRRHGPAEPAATASS